MKSHEQTNCGCFPLLRYARDPLRGSAWSVCKSYRGLQLLAAHAWRTALCIENGVRKHLHSATCREIVAKRRREKLAQEHCRETCIENLGNKLEQIILRKELAQLAQNNLQSELAKRPLAQKTCFDYLCFRGTRSFSLRGERTCFVLSCFAGVHLEHPVHAPGVSACPAVTCASACGVSSPTSSHFEERARSLCRGFGVSVSMRHGQKIGSSFLGVTLY